MLLSGLSFSAASLAPEVIEPKSEDQEELLQDTIKDGYALSTFLGTMSGLFLTLAAIPTPSGNTRAINDNISSYNENVSLTIESGDASGSYTMNMKLIADKCSDQVIDSFMKRADTEKDRIKDVGDQRNEENEQSSVQAQVESSRLLSDAHPFQVPVEPDIAPEELLSEEGT